MKWKNLCLASLLCASLVCGVAGTEFAQNKVSAGRTGIILADEDTFVGTEPDYAEWRYDRNAGIGFRETRRCFAFSYLKGDDAGLKASVPVPQDAAGTAVDIEFISLDVSLGGWAGINYGSPTGEQTNGAFWDCYRAGSGKVHYFSAGANGKINAVFMQIVPVGESAVDYGNDASAMSATFYDGTGKAYASGASSFEIELPQVLENKTLREYYGADGSYELSVREIGAAVSERTVLLRASGLDANPGGYLGLTFMAMRSAGAEISDFAAYACDGAATENSAAEKIFGFKKAGEGKTLSQFTVANQSAFADYIGGEEYSIAFDETSDIGNPFLNRSRVTASEEVELTLKGGFTVKINDLVGNKKFGAVFGVSSLNGDVGDDGTSYLWFSKENGVYGYGLSAYGDGETQLIPFTPLPDGVSEQQIEIDLDLYADGRLIFSIGGEEVYAGEAGEIVPEGYFGFAQSGDYTIGKDCYIDVEIYDLQLRNEFYAKPAAPDVFSDFNDNTLNAQEWLMRSNPANGSGLGVAGGELVFDGAGQHSNITSMYSYSNFELRFDIYGAKNTPTLDANGNPVSGASYWVAVAFGAETASAEDAGYSSSNALMNGSFLCFDASRDAVTGKRTGTTEMYMIQKGIYQPAVKIPKKYAFFDEDFDPETVVTIRVTVLDGVVRIGMKIKDEIAFTEIFSYEYPDLYTPEGNVSIYCEGNQYVENRILLTGSTYKVDNVGLYNWDENGNVIEIGYTSNVPDFIGDYEYTDPWIYEDPAANGASGKGCNSAAGIAAALPATALIGAAAIFAIGKRREKR